MRINGINDVNGNEIYYETSNVYWWKQELIPMVIESIMRIQRVILITDQRVPVMVRLLRLKERNIN
jgi:hypothetical protein